MNKKVNVIAHQREMKKPAGECRLCFRDDAQVSVPVAIIPENGRAIIAARVHVIRLIGPKKAGESWHSRRLLPRPKKPATPIHTPGQSLPVDTPLIHTPGLSLHVDNFHSNSKVVH